MLRRNQPAAENVVIKSIFFVLRIAIAWLLAARRDLVRTAAARPHRMADPDRGHD